MKILAFDTSFAAVSACILVDGQVCAYRHVPTARGHAELLLPLLADLLAQAGLGAGAIARVAVVRGPGHFTGLRAGIAAAQGFAAASGAALIGIDAFAVVGAQMGAPAADEHRLIAFDSKRAEAFVQLGETLPTACAAADFDPPGAAFLVGGDRAELFAARLRTLGKRARVDPGPPLPDAKTLAVLAQNAVAAGPLLPLYIHPPATSAPKPA
jgi:tRNA threonylcarbamoyladenosine biosynthesis protein TsaB